MELLLLAVPFVTSAIMFGAKALSGLYLVGNESSKKPWLRGVLVLVSLSGVVATSTLRGEPLDPNVVADLVTALIETSFVAYFAHAFYNSAFKR